MLLQNFSRLWPLQRQQRNAIADVVERRLEVADVARDVGEILVDVRSVDDHQHPIVGAIDETVVDNRAVFAKYGGVLRLSRPERCDIVRRNVIDERHRLRPAHDELAHVAHVEQARFLAHRFVLGGDPGRVLHRHLESSERHHLGAQSNVQVVKRRPLERFWSCGTNRGLAGGRCGGSGDRLGGWARGAGRAAGGLGRGFPGLLSVKGGGRVNHCWVGLETYSSPQYARSAPQIRGAP